MTAITNSLENPRFTPVPPEWERAAQAVQKKVEVISEKIHTATNSAEARLADVRQRINDFAHERVDQARQIGSYVYQHREEVAAQAIKTVKKEGKYVALGYVAKSALIAAGGMLGYVGAPLFAAGTMIYSGVRGAFSEHGRFQEKGAREYFRHHVGKNVSQDQTGGIWNSIKRFYGVYSDGLVTNGVKKAYHVEDYKNTVVDTAEWLYQIRNGDIRNFSQSELLMRMQSAKLAIDTAATKDDKTRARKVMKELYQLALDNGNRLGIADGKIFNDETKDSFRGLSRDVNITLNSHGRDAWKIAALARSQNAGLRFMSGAFIADAWRSGSDLLKTVQSEIGKNVNPTSHDALTIFEARQERRVYIPVFSVDTVRPVAVDSPKEVIVTPQNIAFAHEGKVPGLAKNIPVKEFYTIKTALTDEVTVKSGDGLFLALKRDGFDISKAGSAEDFLNVIRGHIEMTSEEQTQIEAIVKEYKAKGIDLNATQLRGIYDKVRTGDRTFDDIMIVHAGKFEVNVLDESGEQKFKVTRRPLPMALRDGPITDDFSPPADPKKDGVPTYVLGSDGQLRSADVVQNETVLQGNGRSVSSVQESTPAPSAVNTPVRQPSEPSGLIISTPNSVTAPTYELQGSGSRGLGLLGKETKPVTIGQAAQHQTQTAEVIISVPTQESVNQAPVPTNTVVAAPDRQARPLGITPTETMPHLSELEIHGSQIRLEDIYGFSPVDGGPNLVDFTQDNATEAIYDPHMSIIDVPKKAYTYMVDTLKNNVWIFTHSSGLIEGDSRILAPGEYGRSEIEEMFGIKTPLSEVQIDRYLQLWSESNYQYKMPTEDGDLILQPLRGQLLRHDAIENASQQDFYNFVPDHDTVTFVFCGRAQTEALRVFGQLSSMNIDGFPVDDFANFSRADVDQETYQKSFAVLKKWLIDNQNDYPAEFQYFVERFYLLDANNQLVEKNLSWTRYALTFKVVGGQ